MTSLEEQRRNNELDAAFKTLVSEYIEKMEKPLAENCIRFATVIDKIMITTHDVLISSLDQMESQTGHLFTDVGMLSTQAYAQSKSVASGIIPQTVESMTQIYALIYLWHKRENTEQKYDIRCYGLFNDQNMSTYRLVGTNSADNLIKSLRDYLWYETRH